MRISFVNPTLGGDYSALDIASTTLASYLNQRTTHKASICDLTFHRNSWKSFLGSHIKQNRPDVIGISTTTLYMPYVKQIIKEAKRYQLPVILGGYHASIYPEESLAIDGVDFICIGDGEYVLSGLMDRLQDKSSINDLAGLCFKQGGIPRINSGGSFIEDINSLPLPDWDLWQDLDKFFYFIGMLYIIGTAKGAQCQTTWRGCKEHHVV
ncbi:hypothetical protein EPO66_02995 [bacterium]|nr:MAG: hypothetical protein EPO66_02995 [bacterium]